MKQLHFKTLIGDSNSQGNNRSIDDLPGKRPGNRENRGNNSQKNFIFLEILGNDGFADDLRINSHGACATTHFPEIS